jgi:hypothetical protein
MICRDLPFWVNVISTGRVGTMTLAHLFAHCDGVHAYHEPKPPLGPVNEDYHQGAIGLPQAARLLWKLREPMVDRAVAADCGIIETSSMQNYLAAAFREVYSGVMFIHLHRHPFEYIRSAVRRNNYSATDRTRRTTPPPGTEARRLWQTWTPIQKCAWRWHDVNAIGLREAGLRIASADLFAGDNMTLAALFGITGGPVPDIDSIRSELAARYNAQKKGRFKTYDGWQDDAWAICGETAEALGYQKDARFSI